MGSLTWVFDAWEDAGVAVGKGVGRVGGRICWR